jgi:hypothetical protein
MHDKDIEKWLTEERDSATERLPYDGHNSYVAGSHNGLKGQPVIPVKFTDGNEHHFASQASVVGATVAANHAFHQGIDQRLNELAAYVKAAQETLYHNKVHGHSNVVHEENKALHSTLITIQGLVDAFADTEVGDIEATMLFVRDMKTVLGKE